MKIKFEKHQRDYTLLFSSKVFNEIMSEGFSRFFSYKPHTIFVLVEDGIFYHYIPEKDYKGLPNAWAKKHDLVDLIAYDKKMGKELTEYRQFLKKKHGNLVNAVKLINKYVSDFTIMIFLAAYLPVYVKNLDSEMMKTGLKIRKKYEDVHKVANSLQKKLLSKLERQLNIKKEILEYLTADEFERFILDHKLPKNIESRRNFTFIEYSNSRENIYSKTDAIKKLKTIDKNYKRNIEINDFRGNVAFGGLARGRVKIIRKISESKNLCQGDVLVASMTDPRYLPVMKKAAAIVTDEGGIACHAAIVAREIKKPCIIGTKIATKVLKDGDMVEVDADRGIVKIINKK